MIFIRPFKLFEDDISVTSDRFSWTIGIGIGENDSRSDRLNYLTQSWQIYQNKVENENL